MAPLKASAATAAIETTPVTDINSRDYWSHRFATNWTERHGHEQSRFFGEVAASLLPEWLPAALGTGATVCDWGCAIGEGTAVLAATFPTAKVVGIDFSPVAIEQARTHHPQLEFACRDLLQEPGTGEFDVVFSSNVLEHFTDPATVLTKLARHARRWMVHLVPFREPLVGREPEHLAGFDWRDIALTPAPGWRLLHAAIVDAARLPHTHWLGEQLLLVHATDAEAERVGLCLDRLRIDQPAADATVRALRTELTEATRQLAETRAGLAAASAELTAKQAELAALQAEHAATTAALTSTAAALAAAQARGTDLEQQARAATQMAERDSAELAATRRRLEAVLNSRVWRWTAPLRRAAD